MKLLFIKLPKKEHIENVAGKSSAKISLARNAPKRTYPEKAGVGEAKEVLQGASPQVDWSTPYRENYVPHVLNPTAAGPGVDAGSAAAKVKARHFLAAGKQAGSTAAELEGGVKRALEHAGSGSAGYASTYEVGVGRSGEITMRGGGGGGGERGGGASGVAKATISDGARAKGAGLATNMKEATLEGTFARTLQHPAETRRPPRPWEDEEDVEDPCETTEVRVGENAKAMARRSRRVAKKMLEEIHANPAKRTAFDEQAALSARRTEQEAFWRKALKRNGHWVCGTSEVTTTVGTTTTLTTASTSAAGKALGHTGKEFNYGKLTLPGDTLPKKNTRNAKSTYPWEMDEDGIVGPGAGSTVSASAAAPAAPGSSVAAAPSVAFSAKGESTAVRGGGSKPSSRAGTEDIKPAVAFSGGSEAVKKPMITTPDEIPKTAAAKAPSSEKVTKKEKNFGSVPNRRG